MAPKKDAEGEPKRGRGRPKKQEGEEGSSPAKKSKPEKKNTQGDEKEQEKASAKQGTKRGGKKADEGKQEAKAEKKEEPKAESKDAGKRKKGGAEKDAGGKKAKKGGGSSGAPEHGKDQIENPVQTITNPKETPKGVERDSRGRLVFEGFDDFRPTLTPKQVIQAGSFGGIYFNPTGGKKSVKYPNGCDISADEFPKDWFEGLKDEQFKGTRYNVKLNKYGVKSGQNQQQWEEQGWIKDQDQRGWFQWYCRFTQGRRTEDDERQVGRWTGVAGPKGRWKTRLVNLVKDKGGVDHVQDASISPVIRQNLLHWAYELTPPDYEAMV